MKKTKPEANSLLRVPKAKNKLGLKINPIPMPHDDLIKPEHPKLELVEESMSSHTRLPTQTRHTRQTEIAPIKDFQKVPNSITKAAIPDGLFKQGKSKHLYDVLYSLTRGAIEAKRVIRLSKTKLRKLAGIGSRVTFDSCVSHLETVGLLKIIIHIGEHEGNEFEVFLPEEISQTRQTSHSSLSSHAQNLDSLVLLVSSKTRQSLINESKHTYNAANTSLKTNTKNDDEAFAALNEVFAKASEKITGKTPSKNQQGKWKELAELLVMELEVASARTTSVSDVPAFLTEHLRRRLMPAKKEAAKKEVSKTKTSKSSQVGKQQPSEPIETYEAEPLTEQGRESTKQAFAGYIEKGQKEFLMGLQDSYTAEDWQWLMKELKIT
jgi:hypothetical protein